MNRSKLAFQDNTRLAPPKRAKPMHASPHIQSHTRHVCPAPPPTGGAHKHVRDRSDGEDSGGLCPKGRKVTDLTGAACGQFACSGGGAAGLGLGSRSCGGGAEGGVRGGGGIRPSLDGCAAAVWGASGPR